MKYLPVLLLLFGCSSHSGAYTVRIQDGCLVEIRNVSAERAAFIIKNWEISPDCKVTFSGEVKE
jgi:hypothetical protein